MIVVWQISCVVQSVFRQSGCRFYAVPQSTTVISIRAGKTAILRHRLKFSQKSFGFAWKLNSVKYICVVN
jgi:hypothetical protein